MTRFARARGSKGSNERVPEPATPWSVMKRQFLNDRRENSCVEGRTTHSDTTEGSNEWISNPATPWTKTNRQSLNTGENSSVVGKNDIIHYQLSRNEKHGRTVWEDFGGIDKRENNNNNFEVTKNVSKSSKNIKKLKNKRELAVKTISSTRADKVETITSFSQARTFSANSGNLDLKTKKKKKKKNDSGEKVERFESIERLPSVEKPHEDDNTNVLENEKKKNSKKNKTKHNFNIKFSVSTNSGNIEIKKIMKDTGIKLKRSENIETLQSVGKAHEDNNIYGEGEKKKKSTKNETIKLEHNFGNEFSQPKTNNNMDSGSMGTLPYSSKSNHVKDNDSSNYLKKRNISFEPFQKTNAFGNGRRNHFDDYPDTMILGGNIVEIGEFQGFPVKKEDEVRLKTLKKELQAKGISRKEIEYVLKGERRRAEKALAREKKVACFNCRRFGHNVAECPELGDQTEVGKVCFKCGSTEHKYLDCKVVPEKDAFRFAECFICKEQGHISRQCPDNPRGLYPKGGACKVCGSVTHLKKDCPNLVIGKEKSTITVGTVDQSSELEALDEEVTSENIPHRKKRKIVKF